MRPALRVVPLTVLLLAGSSHALSQAKHFSLSWSACSAHGLPPAFCERAAMAAHNVDGHEWNDMAAHAQLSEQGTSCAGANAALTRLATLGLELGESLLAVANAKAAANEAARTQAASAAAVSLGRALHTIQDNCAHHGMPNSEHSWYSSADLCLGSTSSPDAAPDAEGCAVEETAAVLARVVAATQERALGAVDLLPTAEVLLPALPGPKDLCDYLALATAWDGQGRGWSNEVMRPALRDQLGTALSQGNTALQDVCPTLGGSTREAVDVSLGAPICDVVQGSCARAGDLHGIAPLVAFGTTGGAGGTPRLGCSAADGGAPGLSLLVLLAFLRLGVSLASRS
jgi:hypothetical protein